PVYIRRLQQDYPGAQAEDAHLPLSDVWFKTHHGPRWMKAFDGHPATPQSADDVVELVGIYRESNAELLAWCVPTGADIAAEAQLQSSRNRLAVLEKAIVFGLPGDAPADELFRALAWVAAEGQGRCVLWRRGSTTGENWRVIARSLQSGVGHLPDDMPRDEER